MNGLIQLTTDIVLSRIPPQFPAHAAPNNPTSPIINVIGLAMLAISLERPQPLKRFATQHGVNYTLCWLGRVDVPPPPFDNILAVPVTFFIDRHGVITDVAFSHSAPSPSSHADPHLTGRRHDLIL